ncbi:MAG: hypothetical protein HFI93_10620 [Lachnospiraceae bacterium]|nr:hypothetical protein [Lachnospiraceae bacterium]
MDSIKIAGALLILLAAAGIGNESAGGVRRRLEALYQCRSLTLLLQGQLKYAFSGLSEMLVEAGGRLEFPFSDFCRRLAEKLESMPGQEIGRLWRDTAEETLTGSGLTGKDRERFCELGNALGYLDGESQCRRLESCGERIDREIARAEAETAAKCRLYRSLGVLGGMFVTILFL